MAEAESATKRPSLFRRHWWGLTCLLVFLVGGYYMFSPRKLTGPHPFGPPVYFAKPAPGAELVVENATNSFQVRVSGGVDFNWPVGNGLDTDADHPLPYAFAVEGNTVRITGITPKLTQAEMNAVWQKDPVSVLQNRDGTATVSMGYDIPGQFLNGVYEIEGNRVFGHAFEYGNALAPILFLFSVLVIYITGKVGRMIYRFAKRRSGTELR